MISVKEIKIDGKRALDVHFDGTMRELSYEMEAMLEGIAGHFKTSTQYILKLMADSADEVQKNKLTGEISHETLLENVRKKAAEKAGRIKKL